MKDEQNQTAISFFFKKMKLRNRKMLIQTSRFKKKKQKTF